MKFFLEFLNNFSAPQILHMYAAAAFKTADEIKIADLTISIKVVFQDEHISSEDLEIYKHLQRVVDGIRLRENSKQLCLSPTEEIFRYLCTEKKDFNYFTKYGENEREISKLNIVERRIIFAFKTKHESISAFDWLKGALSELLNYVLREFNESDRVGIVIKHEANKHRKATFPISPKTHLEASIIIDTLNSVIRIKGSFLAEERMLLQVLRIRLPPLYRKFTQQDLLRISQSGLLDRI